MRKPRPAHGLTRLLSHERCVSGQRLAERLGISRSAVWKQLQWLRRAGLEITAHPGRGYRLARAFEALDADRIVEGLPDDSPLHACRLVILDEVDSTNRFLRGREDEDAGTDGPVACLAEWQHAGRGRRGHVWHAPYGGHLAVSLRLEIDSGPETLAGLSLAAGVATLAAIESLAGSKGGVEGIGLKWPNDVLWRDRKLAGILIELDGQYGGRTTVVIGIGVNIDMPRAIAPPIEQPWTDLSEVLGQTPSRNRLAGRLLHELLHSIPRLGQQGLASTLEAWRRHDLLHDRPIVIEQDGQRIPATARGIDAHGRLLVDTASGRQALHAGEVHIQRKPD